MGYYTDYTLTVPADVPKKRCEEINKIVNGWYVFTDFLGTEWYGNAKWYDYEEVDMRDLSRQFPNVLFCLHGEGENRDDLWDAYFMGGKAQFCPAQVTITYESFDPEKLEEVSS